MTIRSVTIDWCPGHISDIMRDVWDFSQRNNVDCTFEFNGVIVKMDCKYVLNLADGDKILSATGKNEIVYLV